MPRKWKCTIKLWNRLQNRLRQRRQSDVCNGMLINIIPHVFSALDAWVFQGVVSLITRKQWDPKVIVNVKITLIYPQEFDFNNGKYVWNIRAEHMKVTASRSRSTATSRQHLIIKFHSLMIHGWNLTNILCLSYATGLTVNDVKLKEIENQTEMTLVVVDILNFVAHDANQTSCWIRWRIFPFPGKRWLTYTDQFFAGWLSPRSQSGKGLNPFAICHRVF